MSVYTVHQPPERSAGPMPAAERLLFVRDGFSFWAFLVTPLWVLWHRMWLVLVAYAIVVAAFAVPMAALRASPTAIAVVAFFVSLLAGLEASTLRRMSLRRRGWTNIGIVSGEDLEDAERRFFDAWLRASSPRRAAEPAPVVGATMPRAPQASTVIGLFPEPGAQR